MVSATGLASIQMANKRSMYGISTLSIFYGSYENTFIIIVYYLENLNFILVHNIALYARIIIYYLLNKFL